MNASNPNAAHEPEPVDFTVVARVLADASVLIRTRGERGETGPTGNRRPRIGDAITRAADLTLTADRGRVRDWALRLAAAHVNAALGRNHDRGSAGAARTLARYGRTVDPVGAVNTAADLVGQAAATAEQIATAAPVPVHGYGPVTAYPLGRVRADAVEPDDIVAVLHAAAALAGHPTINFRILAVRVEPDGSHTFALDMADRPLRLHAEEVNADTGWCRQVWRPVPHLLPPWPAAPRAHRGE
jgi:hypothetical protein